MSKKPWYKNWCFGYPNRYCVRGCEYRVLCIKERDRMKRARGNWVKFFSRKKS